MTEKEKYLSCFYLMSILDRERTTVAVSQRDNDLIKRLSERLKLYHSQQLAIEALLFKKNIKHICQLDEVWLIENYASISNK
jgi:Holliday junction resolvasome RuvABC endonuclease subunit